MAQVGSGSAFHEFCSSACLSLYEAQQQRPAPQVAEASDTVRCSVCYKPGEVSRRQTSVRGLEGRPNTYWVRSRWAQKMLSIVNAA